MIDEATMKKWREMEAAFNSKWSGNRSFEDFILDVMPMPDGHRIVATSILSTMGSTGVGQAMMNTHDDLDFEVGVMVSGGRAYINLGEKLLARGLKRSNDLSYCRAEARKAAKKLVEAVNNGACGPTREEIRESYKEAYHEKRLKDALWTGDVIKCVDCQEYFGATSARIVRRAARVPRGMRKVLVRYHVCPFCNGQNANIWDLKDYNVKVEDWERKMKLQHEAQERSKKIKAMCDACGVDECPGAYKDPCDEMKALLESLSHPSEKTGAPGGEPGPSVPNGTEGKAVNPQGDDGQALPPGVKRFPVPAPTELGPMTFKPTDDREATHSDEVDVDYKPGEEHGK